MTNFRTIIVATSAVVAARTACSVHLDGTDLLITPVFGSDGSLAGYVSSKEMSTELLSAVDSLVDGVLYRGDADAGSALSSIGLTI